MDIQQDNTNDLLGALYGLLGGTHNDSSTVLVECQDGEISGTWTLACTNAEGVTFTVTGSTYREAIGAAIGQATP